MEIKQIVDRMVEIKKEKNILDKEYASLQAKIQVIGEDALKDTKYKSVSYLGTTGKVTVTIADNVKNHLPGLYQDIFGKAYKDLVKTSESIELTAAGKRLAAAVCNEAYMRGSVGEIVDSLKCDEKAKKTLLKKLHGKNFNTDKNNLINIGNLSEKDASDIAYMVSEATAWNDIQAIIKINNNGLCPQSAIDTLIQNVNTAVIVEQSTKITVEEINVSGEKS